MSRILHALPRIVQLIRELAYLYVMDCLTNFKFHHAHYWLQATQASHAQSEVSPLKLAAQSSCVYVQCGIVGDVFIQVIVTLRRFWVSPSYRLQVLHIRSSTCNNQQTCFQWKYTRIIINSPHASIGTISDQAALQDTMPYASCTRAENLITTN